MNDQHPFDRRPTGRLGYGLLKGTISVLAIGLATAFVSGIDNEGQVLVDPWTDGKKILERACTGCHSTEYVYRGILAGRAAGAFKNIPGDYAALVSRENARGAKLTEPEVRTLAIWLSNL